MGKRQGLWARYAFAAGLGIAGVWGVESQAEAATCRASAIKPQARQKHDMLREAETFAHQHHYADARAIYLFALTRFPGDPEIVEAVARVDSWEGCWALAESEYRTVLAAHPEDEEARGGLVDLLSWQSRWREAEALLAEGEARNPHSATLLSRAARLALWRGDATEAARLADEALKLEPADAELREFRESIVLGTASADLRLDAYPGGYPNVYTYGAAVMQRWHKFEFTVDSHIVQRSGGTLKTDIVDGLRTIGATYHPTYGMLLHLDAGYGNPATAIPQYAAHATFSSTLPLRLTGSLDVTYWAFTLGRDVVIFNPSLAYEVNDDLELAVRWFTAYLSIASGDGHPFSSNLSHTIDLHGTWRPKKGWSLSGDYAYGAQLEASPTLESIFSYTSHVLAFGVDHVLRRDLGVRGLLGLERRASDTTSEVIWIESVEVGGYVRW